jgi:hypothetical protein
MWLLIFSFLFASLLSFAQSQQKKDRGFAVIEMFVSEGCGASPPAENAMQQLMLDFEKNNRPVILLTYHVDYWNKYGWKDPFSSFAFTRRQKNYTSALRQKEMFTPQVFLNGQQAFAGGETKKIKAAAEMMLNLPVKDSLLIKIDSLRNDTLWLSYQASRADKNFTLAVILFQPMASSQVKKGDNEGKTLVHKNVVRQMEFFSVWRKQGKVGVALRPVLRQQNVWLVAYLQQKQTKQILTVSLPAQKL